ncbi:transmembrane adaptor Erv26-domain-containing protein [Dichomitus squalens]|uniref:Transmembrane adaptor Erv26-domain-containing protein n=2 Tax=Dichomitus squalens TaxID=114155 RepID=A0A4V2K834_9APHY|nr:uncharacterized protein DICSQDRAFT_157844 [Dichomitus squalens LYAD-421 SS1]EJF56617.1 hypothetical protein DICSQDRAFT_157844 [Dichomitus squalens LYAD-421 SS1]TBU46614.1 transmembrane adaptor Erv26-domain-containing protein [Dichomitus squalens]TBU58408.1 transmembrane adaptor Erv26-domain-containing protein [Dichomitus squalens]
MTLLHLLSYVGAASAFIFITLSLASGLLWISELIEEHSRLAKVVGQRAIYAIILIHFLLCFYDSLPLKQIIFSVFCHIVYLQNFTPTWPFISLSSPSFLGSCVLVVADHFLWFFYFARITQEARHRAQRSYRGPPPSHAVPNFGDIATFFGVCVWLAPLFLFLSLSANDNALPMNAGDQPPSPSKPTSTQSRQSLFKALYDMLPVESIPRLRPRTRRRETTEGILAPRSPSAVHPVSPGLGPVTGMNLPSPLLAPRRVSSDTYQSLSRPSSPSGFSLSAPPKRATVDNSSRETENNAGRRVQMRSRTSYGPGPGLDS